MSLRSERQKRVRELMSKYSQKQLAEMLDLCRSDKNAEIRACNEAVAQTERLRADLKEAHESNRRLRLVMSRMQDVSGNLCRTMADVFDMLSERSL